MNAFLRFLQGARAARVAARRPPAARPFASVLSNAAGAVDVRHVDRVMDVWYARNVAPPPPQPTRSAFNLFGPSDPPGGE